MYKHYDYSQLKEFIQKGRGKTERTIANNTEARIEGEKLIVTLHSTDIAILYPDGRVTLNSGGWHTPTTKDRLNWFIPSPYGVSQKNFEWFILNCDTWENVCSFFNHITFEPVGDGYVLYKAVDTVYSR